MYTFTHIKRKLYKSDLYFPDRLNLMQNPYLVGIWNWNFTVKDSFNIEHSLDTRSTLKQFLLQVVRSILYHTLLYLNSLLTGFFMNFSEWWRYTTDIHYFLVSTENVWKSIFSSVSSLIRTIHMLSELNT